MTAGHRAGVSYLLDPTEENRIGRDPECTVALADPICSRVHAVIEQQEGAWHIRDAGSRNGTFVNDQKIDDAVLAGGHHVRVGSTEFELHLSDQPPTVDSAADGQLTETVIKNQFVGGQSLEPEALDALSDVRKSKELHSLYRLSVKLLACDSPDEVANTALEVLIDWT